MLEAVEGGVKSGRSICSPRHKRKELNVADPSNGSREMQDRVVDVGSDISKTTDPRR